MTREEKFAEIVLKAVRRNPLREKIEILIELTEILEDYKKELLCLLSRLKDLTCFIAAHENQNIGYSIIEKHLDYFPRIQSTTLYSIAQSLTKMDNHDTFAKVELVTELIVKRLMEQVFRLK